MNKIVYIFTFFIISGCTDLWAQSIGKQVANDLNKIEQFEGATTEEGLLDGQKVTRKITYQKPWKVRVETTGPALHAGELFIYDGTRIIQWWPSIGFGIEIRGVVEPTHKQVQAHMVRLARSNLRAYGFSLRSEYRKVAGEPAKEWRIVPTRRGPYRMKHRSWNHKRYNMPLKMQFQDAGKKTWYSMEFDSIDFGASVRSDAFDFNFPDNAIVFRWDLKAKGITLDVAKKQMNFEVMQPSWLPKGHSMTKIIKPENPLPMLTMLMDRGATTLSLTQSRFMGTPLPLGKSIEIKGKRARLTFLGAYTSITWVSGNTLLTLTGNLSFPDIVRIAESVGK